MDKRQRNAEDLQKKWKKFLREQNEKEKAKEKTKKNIGKTRVVQEKMGK